MKNFTYYGTNATRGCEHEWVEFKKGSIIKRGRVVKIQVFECSKCFEIQSNTTTRYPPY